MFMLNLIRHSLPFSIKNAGVKKLGFFFSAAKQLPREFMEPVQSKFEIIGKEKINHDCYIYKFHFAGPKFPLKIGQHFRIIQNIKTADVPQGQEVMKYYTPITSCRDFQNDKIEVLIKIYRPNQDPLYPSGGKLTPFLQKLNIGDSINIEGPFGKFTYNPVGQVQICKNLFSKTKNVYDIKKLFFIAGGTGITPIYQTITQIAKLPNDPTQLTLLYCNKTQSDIVLRKELEALQPRLNLHYMLDVPPLNWKGLSGRVNVDVLNSIHKLDDPQTFYLYCGPKPMNLAMQKIFQQNYPNSNYFKI